MCSAMCRENAKRFAVTVYNDVRCVHVVEVLGACPNILTCCFWYWSYSQLGVGFSLSSAIGGGHGVGVGVGVCLGVVIVGLKGLSHGFHLRLALAFFLVLV